MDASDLGNVRFMVKLQIMTGTGEEAFNLKGITTRVQAAVVYFRMLQELGYIDRGE